MFNCFWRGNNYGVKIVDTTRRQPSIAKITCPNISGILPRKRLFQQLENNKDSPIKWVSGPPGCGKTTLVASYLEAAKMPCLWYQVDEGDVAHLSFKTTLHRLRQLIGRDEIIQLKEGRITLDPRYCWVDVWAFQRLAKKVESLWELDRNKGRDDENIKQFIHLSEQALSMYKGDFLHGDPTELWAVSMREKLESKFTRLILGLCRFYERVGQWDKVIGCCQRGLEIEEFYQRLMTCYHQLGRDADAIKVYRRCCKTLNAVMGVEPSPETETVYKRIAECNNKKDNI